MSFRKFLFNMQAYHPSIRKLHVAKFRGDIIYAAKKHITKPPKFLICVHHRA